MLLLNLLIEILYHQLGLLEMLKSCVEKLNTLLIFLFLLPHKIAFVQLFLVDPSCIQLVPPTDPLEQYLLDHENDMFMKERREIDEVFLKQEPVLKHNLLVEILGDPPPPKGDPVFELKPLPDNLKYAYLDEKKIYPIIRSANLSEQEEERLLKTLKKHRAAIGYTLHDHKGVSPTLCQHKINMEDDAKPVRDPQR